MRRIKALEGKTVEIIENNGTDICIYFTDGSFLGIDAPMDEHLTVNFTDTQVTE